MYSYSQKAISYNFRVVPIGNPWSGFVSLYQRYSIKTDTLSGTFYLFDLEFTSISFTSYYCREYEKEYIGIGIAPTHWAIPYKRSAAFGAYGVVFAHLALWECFGAIAFGV
jgi:hypothetical protein